MIRRSVQASLIVIALVMLPSVARAQVTPAAGSTPPDESQSIGVGAVVFYDYTYVNAPKTTDAAGNSINSSSFNLARTYINVTGRLSSVVAFRITPDITRESGSGSSLVGSLTYRVKYGYAQFNLDRWAGDWRQTYVRLGIQQTPYIDSVEGAYRYRFQGTVFAERDGGMSSADTGASFHTAFPKNYGDVHVGIYNGEGYTKPEINDQKAFAIRATVRPLAGGNSALGRGLRFTAFSYRDSVMQNAERNRSVFSVYLEQPRFNFGFDYLSRSDQTVPTAAKVKSDGYSFFVTPFFKQKGNGFEALIRYDSFRPDTDGKVAAQGTDAVQQRTIAGIAYWFPHPGGNATAALLFDFEQVKYSDYATSKPTDQKIFLHGLINF